VIASLFTTRFYPQAVLPSATILVLALGIGWLVRRRGFNLWRLIGTGFVVVLLVILVSPSI
ncbi:MAG: hypothetical protein GWM88_04120, partial [Pseudomonadales bacterium]|nr:hypothetical protein [Pseudomonadales bacterium]NIX07242.1 hypothetical protein [Pseudomonadales bacterium]